MIENLLSDEHEYLNRLISVFKELGVTIRLYFDRRFAGVPSIPPIKHVWVC